MARISAPAKPKKLAQENSVVQAFLIDPARLAEEQRRGQVVDDALHRARQVVRLAEPGHAGRGADLDPEQVGLLGPADGADLGDLAEIADAAVLDGHNSDPPFTCSTVPVTNADSALSR